MGAHMTQYTDEKNVQIVIFLLKAHGIKNVIASPGATNVTFVASIQNDPYFNVYSCVDERSAAYMACGLAAELGEPVALTCTGATASRNYMPGLTEAYYRKLPVLAITSTQILARVGQHVAQVIDRSSIQNDIARLSVHLPVVKDEDDVWECELKVNKAILELKRHGGGPVHINMPTTYNPSYDTRTLPSYRVMNRITSEDAFPPLVGKVAIFVGAHAPWSVAETEAIDRFCAAHNAVVLCDHTSGYRGKYRVLFALASGQELVDLSEIYPDVLIHIGEISGDYDTLKISGKQVWRVSPDGELRDTFRKLKYVFEMTEKEFFSKYSVASETREYSYLETYKSVLDKVRSGIPDLPFSNIWSASQLASRIPEGSTIHFAILNSLRVWNYFELPESVTSASNVGGFGIDGCMSSLIGASLANRQKLYFLVTGDLAFFYDINALGSRHIGPNIRIILVNNGKGVEFTQYNHRAAFLGKGAEPFVAASGHFGNKSPNLVKNYSENLGFDYISASNKAEFNEVYKKLLVKKSDVPIMFEIFTDSDMESEALKKIRTIEKGPDPTAMQLVKSGAKKIAKDILGKNGLAIAKKLIKT